MLRCVKYQSANDEPLGSGSTRLVPYPIDMALVMVVILSRHISNVLTNVTKPVIRLAMSPAM